MLRNTFNLNKEIQNSAFTTQSNSGLLKQLLNEVIIQKGALSTKVKALWDTGATGTCISKDVVSCLKLIPTGMKNIQTPSGTSQVNTYSVNITLPNNVRIKEIMVCDSEIGKQGIGVLLGMDIITRGDFAVSNLNNTTVFTFRMPSMERTDFVKEINKQNLVGTHGPGKRKKRKK